MMNFPKSLFLFLVSVASLFSLSVAQRDAPRDFYVGGKDGWVPHPKEKYSEWAGRQRFHVNDTLIFKYEKGSDSVLLVHKNDYDKCNKKNPVKKMEGGNSKFQFSHAGSFYFISGKEGHCEKGQKLITIVMSPRHKTPSPNPPAISPHPSPEPAHSPKHHGPVVEPPKASSPGPVLAPSSPSPVGQPPKASSPTPSSPSPVSEPPKASSPTPAPSSHVSPYPGPAHSPNHHGPVVPPPKAISPSPTLPPTSPTPSPKASTPSPYSGPVEAPAPTTVVSPPAPPKGMSPSPSPAGSPAPSGRQTGTPASEAAPAPAPSRSRSSANTTYPNIMVLAGSVLLSMVLGCFVGGI